MGEVILNVLGAIVEKVDSGRLLSVSLMKMAYQSVFHGVQF